MDTRQGRDGMSLRSDKDRMSAYDEFLRARDFLLAHRDNYPVAYRDFRWPELTEFNWALDHFDRAAVGNHQPALWIVNESGAQERVSFAKLSARSNQVGNWLRFNLDVSQEQVASVS